MQPNGISFFSILSSIVGCAFTSTTTVLQHLHGQHPQESRHQSCTLPQHLLQPAPIPVNVQNHII